MLVLCGLGLYCKPVSPTKPNPVPKTLQPPIFFEKIFFAAAIILFAVEFWGKTAIDTSGPGDWVFSSLTRLSSTTRNRFDHFGEVCKA